MTQIALLSGIYVDAASDFRVSLPRNYVPMPQSIGISQGYLLPAEGIVEVTTGPGIGRGGINWNGVCYRVMGSKLCSISDAGVVSVLGDVGVGGQVSMDYSFDKLAVWSDGKLHYWDGTSFTTVTDPDLGNVIDGCWIAGYFMSTDGTSLIVTELADPTSVDPLKYGSSESDPDPIKAVDKLRNEAYALNRYTIEVFQNVGGNNFPFQRVTGAQIPRGVIGTHAYCQLLNTFAFLGSGRNEAPAIYLMTAGNTQKISSQEVDKILTGYTEDQLSEVVMESRTDDGHERAYVHLPDRCLVYDAASSQALGQQVWYVQTSGLEDLGVYRGRNLVRCYNEWLVEDPTSTKLGRLDETISTHYGDSISWDFGTIILYNDGNGLIVHEIELVALTGHVSATANPVIWSSYSLDGETWSQERPKAAGKQGQRAKRIVWRRCGKFRNW